MWNLSPLEQSEDRVPPSKPSSDLAFAKENLLNSTQGKMSQQSWCSQTSI